MSPTACAAQSPRRSPGDLRQPKQAVVRQVKIRRGALLLYARHAEPFRPTLRSPTGKVIPVYCDAPEATKERTQRGRSELLRCPARFRLRSLVRRFGMIITFSETDEAMITFQKCPCPPRRCPLGA